MKRITLILFLIISCTITHAQKNALARIPFQLTNNHIYLQLKVNNSKPLWFVLDTGAPSIISLKNATDLGLELYAPQKASGVGDATTDAAFTREISFQVGDIKHVETEVAVVSLAGVEECANKLVVDSLGNILEQDKKMGDPPAHQAFDGILGSRFFKSYVVEINFREKYLLLYDPKSWQYKGNGKIIPIDTRPNHIFTYATVHATGDTGITGYFMIDTGYMLAVSLNTPFIRKHNLMPAPSQTRPLSICGIGGNSKAQMGTIQKLTLQGLPVDLPPAVFSQATGGVLTSTDFDGHIGNAVLRKFNVIFDYTNKRMILE